MLIIRILPPGPDLFTQLECLIFSSCVAACLYPEVGKNAIFTVKERRDCLKIMQLPQQIFGSGFLRIFIHFYEFLTVNVQLSEPGFFFQNVRKEATEFQPTFTIKQSVNTTCSD